MTTVYEAEQLIKAQARSYGTQLVALSDSLGRVLAEDLTADRDMPPFNRVTMDGIAIRYKEFADGQRSFHIAATQAAGEMPVNTHGINACVEIMTGAVLPDWLDTVIRYEDVEITGATATIVVENVAQGQNIHNKGKDKVTGNVVAAKGQLITPAIIGIAASVGKTEISVQRLPKVVIISSGDELVEIDKTPELYQIRRSNNYTIQSALKKQGLYADMLHIPDEPEYTRLTIKNCLESYDVILLSGGISMGKFDYIPQALEDLSVAKIFHKVQQRPGKPFWFGANGNNVLVFAFPGNPVATFMCLHRYFLPWLQASIGLPLAKPVYAVLAEDFTFKPQLQYFLQVQTYFTTDGRLMAKPLAGNGSGDFANLADTDAFMELPANKFDFKAGEVYPLWPF